MHLECFFFIILFYHRAAAGAGRGRPALHQLVSEEPAHLEEELAVIVISDASSEEHRTKQRLEQKSDGCILRELPRARRLTISLSRLVHRKQIYILLQQRRDLPHPLEERRLQQKILVGQQLVRPVSSEAQRAAQAEGREPGVPGRESGASRCEEQHRRLLARALGQPETQFLSRYHVRGARGSVIEFKCRLQARTAARNHRIIKSFEPVTHRRNSEPSADRWRHWNPKILADLLISGLVSHTKFRASSKGITQVQAAAHYAVAILTQKLVALVYEKRTAVGDPMRCAEPAGIGREGMKIFCFESVLGAGDEIVAPFRPESADIEERDARSNLE